MAGSLRDQMKALRDKTTALQTTTSRVSGTDQERALLSNETILADLIKLAFHATEQIADTRYRFTSAIAYSHEIIQRIDELREEKLDRWTRIGTKIRREFIPQIKTCIAVIMGQENLSKGIIQKTTMLNTNVENLRTSLDKQNQQKIDDSRLAVSLLSVIIAAYAILNVLRDSDSERWLNFVSSSVIAIILVAIFYFVCKQWRKFVRRQWRRRPVDKTLAKF